MKKILILMLLGLLTIPFIKDTHATYSNPDEDIPDSTYTDTDFDEIMLYQEDANYRYYIGRNINGSVTTNLKIVDKTTSATVMNFTGYYITDFSYDANYIYIKAYSGAFNPVNELYQMYKISRTTNTIIDQNTTANNNMSLTRMFEDDANYIYDVYRDSSNVHRLHKIDKTDMTTEYDIVLPNIELNSTYGIDANYIYISLAGYEINKYSLTNGNLIDSFEVGHNSVYDIAVDDNYIYASDTTDDIIFAINKTTGVQIWENTIIESSVRKLTVDNGYLYGSVFYNTQLVAFDTLNGDILQTYNIAYREPGESELFNPIYLTVSNGDIYYTFNDNPNIVNQYDIPIYSDHTINFIDNLADVGDYNGIYEAYTVTNNTTLSEPSDPIYALWAFIGWYTDEALTNEFNFITQITSDTTLYAKWVVDAVYTVNFYRDTTLLDTQYIDATGYVDEPTSDPVLSNHQFDGWYADAALTTPFDFDTPITVDTDIYAKFIEEHRVQYYDNFSVIATTYVLDGELADDYTPTKTGYVFDDWYSDSALTTPFDFTTPITAETDIYAGFTAIYDVTYYDGTNILDTIEVLDGELADEPTNPTKAGYVFDGWYADAALTTPFNFTNPITADTNIYAGFTELFTVTYYDGSNILDIQYVLDGELADDYTPTKVGHDFVDWYTNNTLTTPFDFATSITADTNIYAEFEPAYDYTINSPYFHYNTQDLDFSIDTLIPVENDIALYRLGENGSRVQTLDTETVIVNGTYDYLYDFPLNANYPYELVINGETVRKGYTTQAAHGSFYDRSRNVAIGSVARNLRGVVYQHDPYNLSQAAFRYGSNLIVHLNFDTVTNDEYIRFFNENLSQYSDLIIELADVETYIGLDSDFIILPTNGKMPNYIDDNLEDYYRNFTQDYNYSYDYTVTLNSNNDSQTISEPGAFANTNGLANADIYINGEKVVDNGESLIPERYTGDVYGYDYKYEDGAIEYYIYFITNTSTIGGVEYNPGDIVITEITGSTSPTYPIDVRVVLNVDPIDFDKAVYTYDVVENPISPFKQKGESILVIGDSDYIFKVEKRSDSITEGKNFYTTITIPDANVRNLYRDVRVIDGFTNKNYSDDYVRTQTINTFNWVASDPLNLDAAEVIARFDSTFYNLAEYDFAYESEYTITEAVPINEQVNEYFDSTGLGGFGKVLIMVGIFGFIAIVTMAFGAPKWATMLVLVALFILFAVFGIIPIWFVLIITVLIFVLGYMLYTKVF